MAPIVNVGAIPLSVGGCRFPARLRMETPFYGMAEPYPLPVFYFFQFIINFFFLRTN